MTGSTWYEAKDPRGVYPPLTGDAETDVAIVGGGITGITCAYLLAKAGKRVLLLEQDKLLSGDSGRTTAFFTYLVDAPLTHLKGTFGEQEARLVWTSNRETIDDVERIIQEEKIDCGFARCPAWVYGHDEKGREDLREIAALGQAYGFPVSFSDGAELPFKAHGCLRAPDQAKLHPIRYLEALAAKAKELGADIRERTHVHAIEGDGPVTLMTSKGSVTAREIVVATHGPVTHPIQVPSRLIAQRTYVVEAAAPAGSLPEGLYWNTEDPYHYFRVDRGAGEDRLLLGGEDHVTGKSAVFEDARFETLKAYFRALFPNVPMKFSACWSGQIYETIDGLPYIGRPVRDGHQYVATGYNGNGMTYGTLAARIIADEITKGSHPWSGLYRTMRPHGIGPFAEQSAAFVKELLQRRLDPDVASTDAIAPGHGAVVVENGKPVAAYRDENGALQKCSAVCTHLRCTVRWNGAEKSWDCPCHGSRFGTDGRVLNGPAITPLDRA